MITVTLLVVAEQPVAVAVNVKLTTPDDFPVTSPALVILALAGSLLTHVPPEVGVKVMVLSTKTEAAEVLTIGSGLTVMVAVPTAKPVV